MFRRHSRGQKQTVASPETSVTSPEPPVVAHISQNQEPRFHVGERVKTLTELGGWPAESTGYVQHLADDGRPNIRLDNGFWYDATPEDVERLPPEDPHVFQVENRVRLAKEFVGKTWASDFAGEGDGPDGKGDPISYPVGSTGTIANTELSPKMYIVALDDNMKLLVPGIILERIPGRARVFTDPDGDTMHVRPVFRYMDEVRLRRDLAGEEGIYLAGWTGQIRPSIHVAPAPGMRECWSTDNYTVWLDQERGIVNVPAGQLQLVSDTR